MLNYNYINGVNSEGEIIEIDAFPGAQNYSQDPKVVLNYTSEATAGNPIQHHLEQVGLASFAQTLAQHLVDIFYPVGTIYCTKLNDVYPFKLFPGTTWTRVAGNSYLRNNTNISAKEAENGGRESFTLTTSNLPAHVHGIGGGTQSTKITGTTKEGEGTHSHALNPPLNSYQSMWTSVKLEGGGTAVLPQYPLNWDQNYATAIASVSSAHTHTFDATIDITLPTSTKSTGSGTAVSLNPSYYGCYMWLRIK